MTKTNTQSSQVRWRLLFGLLCLACVRVLRPSFNREIAKERCASERGGGEEKMVRETCLDPDGPRPFVLMSLGRSGSGSTWQVIGNLTGQMTPSLEYTGSSTKQSEVFFNQTNPGPSNDRWLLKFLCHAQLAHHEAGVVGFKWKPNEAIFSPSARAGLRLMAALERPRIGVVRSRRNPLDVLISQAKHGAVAVPAHCKGRRAAICREKSIEAGRGLALPTKHLLEKLRTVTDREDRVDAMLDGMGVPHVKVSYERLYYPDGDDVSEWTRIFAFLGTGPAAGLTRARLEGAMDHVATSVRSHRAALANYDDVAGLLNGTEFESLLH